jgi:hypothetical protein
MSMTFMTSSTSHTSKTSVVRACQAFFRAGVPR